MIYALPPYVPLVFMATTFITLGILLKALRAVPQGENWVRRFDLAALIWLVLQGYIAYKGYYLDFAPFPPRFLLAIGPPLLAVVLVFVLPSRSFVNHCPLLTLTYLHTVRIPVELVLWWLYQAGQVPQLITFEGRNFDILAGLTAPIVAYLWNRGQLGRLGLGLWNLVALALLLNVVGHAILAAPTPFQRLAFDQPNVGVMYLPFIWLPAVVVPIVLFSHLTALGKLIVPAPEE